MQTEDAMVQSLEDQQIRRLYPPDYGNQIYMYTIINNQYTNVLLLWYIINTLLIGYTTSIYITDNSVLLSNLLCLSHRRQEGGVEETESLNSYLFS